MGNEYIKTSEAAALLDRTVRRVQQLVDAGAIKNGPFIGSVTLETVLNYKRAIDRGDVRRGPKRKVKKAA